MMMVSVIVCTYNQERTIGRALDAILSQECDADFEVIIGEDASRDNTRRVCEEYAERYPGKVRLMPKAPNKGIVDNYYGCVREAKGEYIMECGGDDEWCPGRMQLCLDVMRQHSDVVQVFTQVYYRRGNTGEILTPNNDLFPMGLLSGQDVIDGMMHQRSGQMVCYAMTRRKAMMELMEEYPEFFAGRKYFAEDKQLTTLLGTKGNFVNLPDRTYYYTIDNSSITRGDIAKHWRYTKNMMLMSHNLAKAVGYRKSLMPQYLHILFIVCRFTVWRLLSSLCGKLCQRCGKRDC